MPLLLKVCDQVRIIRRVDPEFIPFGVFHRQFLALNFDFTHTLVSHHGQKLRITDRRFRKTLFTENLVQHHEHQRNDDPERQDFYKTDSKDMPSCIRFDNTLNRLKITILPG
jgi:hypothetical protein